LALAVYEGVALSLLEIVVANRVLGAPPSEIFSGTPLVDRGWAQLRADMYGLPLIFPGAEDLTGLGAALLALVNQGVFTDLAAGARATSPPGERVEHNPARTEKYEQVRGAYMRAVEQITPLFAPIRALPGEA
jgi:sugar (pentulose or hexulose) kinase